jgi:hypothetical protein
VFQAIQRVGFAAVHPVSGWEGYLLPSQISEEDKATADQLRNRLRELVWKRVERWYRDARYSMIHEQRKQGAELLKRFGAELAGDRRGLGKGTIVDAVSIARAYFVRLFRLSCAMHRLRQSNKDDRLHKALRASYAFGLIEPPYVSRRVWDLLPLAEQTARAESFLRHLRYRFDSEKFGTPPTVKATAREWTARWAGIEPQTLSNLLSRYRN